MEKRLSKLTGHVLLLSRGNIVRDKIAKKERNRQKDLSRVANQMKLQVIGRGG